MSSKNDYRYKNVIQSALNAFWLCWEQKVDDIRAFLEAKASGLILDEDSVQAVFSPNDYESMFLTEDGVQDIDGIRYVPLFGVMSPKMNLMTQFSGGTSTQQFMKSMKAAASDDSVKTILMHIDSPGGVSTMIPEAAALIREIRETKRVVAYAGTGMMSGALWVGTAATHVVGTESSQIGSHGVYVIHRSAAKANEEMGQKFTVVRAGENKVLANPHEDLTEEARAELQRGANKTFERFTAGLALNRNITEATVLSSFGQGLVFGPEEALSRGMIDAIVPFDDFVEEERRRNVSVSRVTTTGDTNMYPRVKAALVATGRVKAEETDDRCEAILNGVAIAHGMVLGELSEEEQVQLALNPESVTTELVTLEEVVEPARNVLNNEQAELRQRNAQIQVMCEALDLPPSQVLVYQSEEYANHSITEIREVLQKKAASESESVLIVPGDSSLDKFAEGATAVMLDRTGHEDLVTREAREYGSDLQSASLMEIARTSLRIQHERPSGNPIIDAKKFLSMGTLGGGARSMVAGEGGTINRRGQHPDAIGGLVSKILDGPYDEAATTYQYMSEKVADVADFEPKSFVEAGRFWELDMIEEGEDHEELSLATALKAWIRVRRYGDKVGLTVEMVIGDNLGAFTQQLESLRPAAAYTLDNMVRDLFVSNPTMVDGVALFSNGAAATRDLNLIASGVVISEASVAAMNLAHMNIKGYGSKRKINRKPDTLLVPGAIGNVAAQVLAFGPEVKTPATDGTVNRVRGQFGNNLVVDANLDDNSTTAWYTILSSYKPIMHTYLRGTGGAAGTRTTWTEPDSGTRYAALDVAMGVAPYNWRGAVKNPGA